MAARARLRRHVRCRVRAVRLTGSGRSRGYDARVGRLSASILSADFAHLAAQVKLIEPHAEAIHVDVMDARFVPPITIGPVVEASLRPVTERVLHGHLTVEAPAALFDDLADAGLDIVSFHHEARTTRRRAASCNGVRHCAPSCQCASTLAADGDCTSLGCVGRPR